MQNPETDQIQNVEIVQFNGTGSNTRRWYALGYIIYDKDWYLRYLHKDGSWHRSTSIMGHYNGYFDTKEEIETLLTNLGLNWIYVEDEMAKPKPESQPDKELLPNGAEVLSKFWVEKRGCWIVLATWDKGGPEYMTWRVDLDMNCYWGRYFDNLKAALSNFTTRIAEGLQ